MSSLKQHSEALASEFRHRYQSNIVIMGSDNEIQEIKTALDSLMDNSPTADRLIHKVNDGSKMMGNRQLSIVRGPIAADCSCANCRKSPCISNCYSGDLHRIVYTPMFNPYGGTEDWMFHAPEIALGHELVHALHETQGIYQAYGKMAEEYMTVGIAPYFHKREFTENAIRRDYGLPERPRY